MISPPNPTWLFHITAIDNLSPIFESGALKAKNLLSVSYRDIAEGSIQNTRSGNMILIAPGGTIHDYVPFYFAPRSPMLCSIHNKRSDVDQSEIVHMVTSAQLIHELRLPYVFFDGHAIMKLSRPFNDIQHLSEIQWRLIMENDSRYKIPGGYCKYFHDTEKTPDRMRVRMAEFLVKEKLDCQHLKYIVVMTEEKAVEVKSILARHDMNIEVQAIPEWYF